MTMLQRLLLVSLGTTTHTCAYTGKLLVISIVMRYIDWLITVPLQVSEFYLILAAIGAASAVLFWKLFGASIVMLVAGFLSEAEIDAVEGMEYPLFAIGVLAWLYIIYEHHGLEKQRKKSATQAKVHTWLSKQWLVS